MFAKIVNGKLVPAKFSDTFNDGAIHARSKDDILTKKGYMQVVTAECPEIPDGYTADSYYDVVGNEIHQIWGFIPIPKKEKSKLEILMDLIQMDDKPKDRIGHRWVPMYNPSTMHIGWEEIEDQDYIPSFDGSDYLLPIKYIDGLIVKSGLWYSDGEWTFEAISDGVPSSFYDSNYFDVVM